MKRVLKAIYFLAVWVVLGVTIHLLASGMYQRRDALTVSDMVINIADSTANGNLITRAMVEQILKREKISTVGAPVRDLPLTRIEEAVSRNGFVQNVVAYVDYAGVLNIDIGQRSATLRLLLNGYNCYITSEGFIFDAPSTTALNTPVVTGSYRPLFAAGYSGYVDDRKVEMIEALEREIERVEREKYPIFERERENAQDRRDVRRRYINQRMMESDADFAQRVEALREENRKRRERYAAIQRKIDAELQTLDKQQERYRAEQKKVEKKCEDIHNLIIFVELLEKDPFWSSEVVQIELRAGSGSSGEEMKARLAVRSGKFIVNLGSLSGDAKQMRTEVAGKLSRLKEFYAKALPRVGWDRYKEINIEYKNQVICKK